jgi:hypothetical protein
MSWLRKLVSKTSAQGAEQVAEKVLNGMPTAQCITAEPVAAAASEPAAYAQDENPIKQRRYFVKQGLLVDHADHEDELAAGRAVESADEVVDKRAIDLKTLFPKISLR